MRSTKAARPTQPVRSSLAARAAVHAALGEPVRLTIVDELAASDRSPRDLAERLGIPSNLLAHHLDVLEGVGLITRSASAGDGRRKYVRLDHRPLASLGLGAHQPRGEVLFLCTHNSARSQLAAAVWSSRAGQSASSAGTHPADRIDRRAIAAAKRAGVPMAAARPRPIGPIGPGVQVVTVCDRAHEELEPGPTWWHWSIPDPVAIGSARAFDRVIEELEQRIALVAPGRAHEQADEEAHEQSRDQER